MNTKGKTSNRQFLAGHMAQYKELADLETFTARVEIRLDEERGSGYKKIFTMPPGWQKARDPAVKVGHNTLLMHTGERNGIFVLDIDVAEDWERLLAREEEEEPLTWRQETGGGKFHLVFLLDARLQQFKGASPCILPKGETEAPYEIDSRTTNNCIVVSPTEFDVPISKAYRWVPGRSPLEGSELLPMPQWLVDVIRPSNGTRSGSGGGGGSRCSGPVAEEVARSRSEVEAKNNYVEARVTSICDEFAKVLSTNAYHQNLLKQK
jgi:hypothetical protein